MVTLVEDGFEQVELVEPRKALHQACAGTRVVSPKGNRVRGHRKWRFPLLADFEPKGAVARTYGAYRHSDGVCERALFVLDAEGTIHWSYLSPIGINPGADGILVALEALSKQEAPG